MTRKNVIKLISASLIFIIIFGILTAVLERRISWLKLFLLRHLTP